jgi:hypothetical protein
MGVTTERSELRDDASIPYGGSVARSRWSGTLDAPCEPLPFLTLADEQADPHHSWRRACGGRWSGRNWTGLPSPGEGVHDPYGVYPVAARRYASAY